MALKKNSFDEQKMSQPILIVYGDGDGDSDSDGDGYGDGDDAANVLTHQVGRVPEMESMNRLQQENERLAEENRRLRDADSLSHKILSSILELRPSSGSTELQLANKTLTPSPYLPLLNQQGLVFEQIVDALGDLVCVKDAAQQYLFVNKAFAEFVGIASDGIIGKTDHELFDADTADRILSGDDTFLGINKGWVVDEVRTRWDGVPRHILIRKDIYFDQDGHPITVTVGRDISELRKKEEESRHALAKEKELNELKSRFVSMVSHEYKTPLTAILSSAELLELFRTSWSEAKVDTHIQKIKRAVETMIEMITDALFLNKIETGKITISPSMFDLVTFCIMIADEMQAFASGNPIEFSSTTTHAVISIDNKFLRYIFANILSNALKYSFPNTSIHFDMNIVGQTGIFRISNRGIGIPPEHIERLFEPFSRATNIGAIQGTGLGLSIVKRCVDSLRGSIEVESIPNESTTFTITLPISVMQHLTSIAHNKQNEHAR